MPGPGGPATPPERAAAQAFEHMPAVLWAFEGPECRVTAANRLARASTGDRPDIIGRPIRDVLPEFVGQQVFEMMDEVYRTGRTVTGADRRMLVDRDGDGRLEEDYYTYTFVPTHGPDGTVDGMVAHVVEVTGAVRSRQQAEERADTADRRYELAHSQVVELQRALLPAAVPVLPRLRVAARYLVAGPEQAAGGDWFEAVPLPDGRLAVVVGDVVGHGVRAAALMGQLRAVVLDALRSGGDPGECAARADRFTRDTPGSAGTTLAVAVLDPDDGTVRYLRCGHPPLLVLGPDGATGLLDDGSGPTLGVEHRATATATARVPAGGVLVLFSDGLIERPGRTWRAGLDELATVAGAIPREELAAGTSVPAGLAERVSTLLVERFGMRGFHDDVTVLAVEWRSRPVVPFRHSLPARAAALSTARRALAGWLTGEVGCAPADVVAIVHAVGEVVTNAVEHAYTTVAAPGPDAPGPDAVVLAGGLDRGGNVVLTVADRGRWRPADTDPGGRGRGLALAAGLIDSVRVDRAPDGTCVELRHRITRPVAVGEGQPITQTWHGGEEADLRTVLTRSERPVLAVSGSVDLATVGRLRTAVVAAARGGALPVVLDLTGVTHLASTGVQLLVELADGRPVRAGITAPPDSIADQVLAVSGLADLNVGS